MARLSDAQVKALTLDIPTRNVIHMLQDDIVKLQSELLRVTEERNQMMMGYDELRAQLLALKSQLRVIGAIG